MGSHETVQNDESATISDDSSATRTDSEIETETDTDIECAINAPAFHLGDKVLARHSSLWYEAKVRRVEFRDKEWRYLVHYWGWKEKWDEWVVEDRLREYDQAVLKKQDSLEHVEQETTSDVPQPKSSSYVMRYKKRKNNSLGEVNLRYTGNGAITSEKLLNLRIPPTLKKQLVDDCEFITHFGKLVKLPRIPNVNELLQTKYIDYILKKDGRVSETIHEFVKDLEMFFNKSLPVILLYKSERKQYNDAVRAHVDPSGVYGAEHLLRLFVKLPNILARAKLENDTLAILQKEIVHFLKFLQRNQNDLFLSSYYVIEDSEAE